MFPAGLSDLPSTSPKECYEVLLEKFTSSSSLSHYEHKNKSFFGGKLSVGLSKGYESSEEHFGEKQSFRENWNYFYTTSTFWTNFFRSSGENIPWGLSEPQFTSTEESLYNFFCKKNILFNIFVLNLQRLIQLFSKMFCKLVKNATWLFRGTI